MPKRKHKKYRKPKKSYDRARIDEEDLLVKKYGLKNKTEIWKAESEISEIRRRAKELLTKSDEDSEKFIAKLNKQGFVVKNIADILALDKEDYLKRRLQSILVEKKIANSPRQARQFITHKHVTINNNAINIPSYIVPVDEENKINLRLVRKEKIVKDPVKEIYEEKKETAEENATVEENKGEIE